MNRRKLRKFDAKTPQGDLAGQGFWSRHGAMISLSICMLGFSILMIVDYSDDQIVNLRGADLPSPISIGLITFFTVASVISIRSTIKDLIKGSGS